MDNEQRGRLIKAFVDVRKCLQSVAGQGRLTQGEFLVLRRIKIEREGSTQKLNSFKAVRISQYLSMPPPAVSRILNSLEAKRLIQRQINEDNRRSVVIILTDLGKDALADAESRVTSFVDKVADELGEEDTQKLLGLLETVIEICVRENPNGGDDNE